jgi:hypothetical protein
MTADLDRLDALLSSIGWTRAQMERATGHQIRPEMPGDVKRLVWGIIRDPDARDVLARWRVWFPDAIVLCMRF